MRKEYDFSKSVKNPYAKKLKSRTTIRLDEDIIEYFQKLADKSGVPYQTLINLYLNWSIKHVENHRMNSSNAFHPSLSLIYKNRVN